MAKTVDRSYVLHEKLGDGGMGTVYRATHLVSGEQVALKLVRMEAETSDAEHERSTALEKRLRLALAREFETLASLHHPNVIRVLSYGFDDELGSYFTMELLDAPATILKAAAALSLPGKIDLIGQLLRALIYIHQRRILHRDIKPSDGARGSSLRSKIYAVGLRTCCGLIGWGVAFQLKLLMECRHRHRHRTVEVFIRCADRKSATSRSSACAGCKASL